MKIRSAFAGLLIALVIGVGAAPAAMAATPTAAAPTNVYNETVPGNFYTDVVSARF